jgi:hypothetical protein
LEIHLKTASTPAELFTPTLTETVADRPPGHRPWALQSQFYVMLGGGPAALTIVAWRNARRLGLPWHVRYLIAAFGLVGTLLSFGAALSFRLGNLDPIAGLPSRRWPTSLTGGIAAVLYLLFYWWQLRDDRLYQVFEGSVYDSFWKTGALTVLFVTAIEVFILIAFKAAETAR